MPKEWTPEERAAFGQKMAERRAAARASSDSATEEAQTEVTTEKREYAKATDIPGARPITGKKPGEALSADQLVEAPDTGFAATAGTGQGGALVVESATVIGGGPGPSSAGPGFADRKRLNNGGTVVADRMLEPGDVIPEPNADRGFGPADPTGLPCSCAMGTTIKGRHPSETWCIVCGGELDGKTRPENALKGRRNVAVRAATALTQADYDAITAKARADVMEELVRLGVLKQS